MKNIPIFTGSGCLSTLILEAIPYKKEAYILVRTYDRQGLAAHLAEASGLCAAAGAKRVFAGCEGEKLLPDKAPAYEMWEYTAPLESAVGELDLSPLTLKTAAAYAGLYASCFDAMTDAKRMTLADAKKLAEANDRRGYIFFRDGSPAAFGELEFSGKTAMLNSIGVSPEFRGGLGGRTLVSLMAAAGELGADKISVKVMSTNVPALRMYEKAGFCLMQAISVWYLM